ncbi:hypothetical protein P8452_38506 [Trifolium repens]|nr:hypothetical protein P8452_38506 [Trifolium repens]
MEDCNFVVGQVFPDVKAFRNAIKEAAIAQHFELRIIKSDLIRYFAKCASDGCPWRIRAVKLPNASTFIIRSLEGTHTCGRNALNGHHQASVDWIVIERIHGNLITQFDDRRLKSSSWYSVLTPSAERRMVEAINHASTYQVLRSDEVEFEVISADRSNIVNIGSRSCSCRDWQLYGIPCSHAVAALISCRKDVYAYTAKCFTVASYRDTYAEELHPVPRKLEWRRTDESSLDNDITVLPLLYFLHSSFACVSFYPLQFSKVVGCFGFRSADQINYVEMVLIDDDKV